jgi:hypothetical protein
VQNEAEPAGGTSTPKIDAVRMTVYYCVDGDAPAGNDEVYLASADGEEWEPAEDADPGTVTICGVEYALTFSREGCDGPCLTLTSDGGTAYTAVRDCCGPNYAIFSIGNVAVCSGTTDTAAGPVGNTVRIKVEWTCCPADGYAGAGYYCVRDAGTSDLCVAVEVTSAADVCADEVEICDGPYSTLEEAQAACPTPLEPVTGGADCASALPVALDTSYRVVCDWSEVSTSGLFKFTAAAGQAYKVEFTGTSPSLRTDSYFGCDLFAATLYNGKLQACFSIPGNVAERVITMEFTNAFFPPESASDITFTVSEGTCPGD